MTLLEKLPDVLARNYLRAFLIPVFRTLKGPQAEFHDKWFVKAMCRALEKVKAGEETRLILEVPPRHLKSMTTSVAFTAWLLGHNPELKIMVVSYGAELAEAHARDLRHVMKSAWYKRMFPRTVVRTDTANELVTTAGGGRRAVSVGGALTGLGADVIIIDDSIKAGDAHSEAALRNVELFYNETLYSRLNDRKSGRIVIIQQRVSERDLVGQVKESGGYTCLSFPAVATKDESFDVGEGQVHHRKQGDLLYPEAFPQEVLDDLRVTLGPAAYAAQYQQDPSAPEGNRIRLEWFGSYEVATPREAFSRIVMSIDAAASELPSSDYSVYTVWGHAHGKFYLLDLLRQRFPYPELKRRVLEASAHWRVDKILIENASNGMALFQDLFYVHGLRGKVIKISSTIDKALRVEAATAELETGKFLLPKSAPWYPELVRELRAFPAGRYDDQVDSVIQFVNWQKLSLNRSFLNPRKTAVASSRLPLNQRIHDAYRQRDFLGCAR